MTADSSEKEMLEAERTEVRDALSECSDEELVRLCRDSSRSVPYYSELIFRYFGFVKSKAAAMCELPSACDDFVQEGMLGLMSAVRGFDPEKGGKFSSYAYSCVVNRMKTAAAKQSREPANEDGEEPPYEITPESIIIQRELFRELDDSLSPMEHDALLLHISGHSAEEIARRCGVSAKAAANAVGRARSKLRSKLS